MYLGFMRFLPYEACLIIPLQTLLIGCMSPQNTNTSAAMMKQEYVYHQLFRTPVMAVKIYNF
jgi:hypothetical protein